MIIPPEGQKIISLVTQGKWREALGNPADIDIAHLRLCDEYSAYPEVINALHQAKALAEQELKQSQTVPIDNNVIFVPQFMRWIAVFIAIPPVQLLALACTALLLWYQSNLLLTISVIILALICALTSQKRSPGANSWFWVSIFILLCGGFSASMVFILDRFTPFWTWACIVLGIIAGLVLSWFPGLSLLQAMTEKLQTLNFWTGLGLFCVLFMIDFGAVNLLLAEKPFIEIVSSAFYYIQENDWLLWGFTIVLALILAMYFVRLYGIQKWESVSELHLGYSLTLTILTDLIAIETFFHIPFIVSSISKLDEISGPFLEHWGGLLLYYGAAGALNIIIYVILVNSVNAISRKGEWSLVSRMVLGASLFLISMSLISWLTPIPKIPSRYFLATFIEPPEAGSITFSKRVFDRGEQVTLIVEPASGYVFERWGGNIDSVDNPVTMTMKFDRKAIAYLKASAMPAPSPSPAPISQKLLFEDNFSDSNSGWTVSSDENIEWSYKSGEYSGLVKKANSSYGGRIPKIGWQNDFTIEVDVRDKANVAGSFAGIIFRDTVGLGTDNNRYLFYIRNSDGAYRIRKVLQNQNSTLQDWTKSSYIRTGADTNHLKVVCRGANIEVYVNGQKLAAITDISLTSGGIGLIVGTSDQPNAHYYFDNFKLYVFTNTSSVTP